MVIDLLNLQFYDVLVRKMADRKHWVVVERMVSKYKSNLTGVPQSLILETILCLIYINDLDDDIIR